MARREEGCWTVGGQAWLGGVLLLPCGGRHGLVLMSVDWWGMVNNFIFGQMCGLLGCPLGKGLADCLSCRWVNECLC